MAKTKEILKSALDKLDGQATDKNVQSGAKESTPDLPSSPQGTVESESDKKHETKIKESEKSADDSEDKEATKSTEAPKGESAEKSQSAPAPTKGDAEADRVENGKSSDDEGDDDDESASAKSKKSIETLDMEPVMKSINANSEILSSASETLKSLPENLSEAIAKSIDAKFEALSADLKKSLDEAIKGGKVQNGKNSKDLTQSEKATDDKEACDDPDMKKKDMDASQDQSQKSESAEKGGKVQNGKNSKDLTQSEKDAGDDDGEDDSGSADDIDESAKKPKSEANKSLEGTSKAIQTDDEDKKETAEKSVKAPAYTKAQIQEAAKNLEDEITTKSFTSSSQSAKNALSDIFNVAKSARESGKTEDFMDAYNQFREYNK